MKKLLLFALLIPLVGCAVGNQYNYESANVKLPVKGGLEVRLDVDDERSYVVSGDKKPDFVGLQRGGFGNPFNVTTASGKPLADDFLYVLLEGLKKQGYKAEGVEYTDEEIQGVKRLVVGGADRVLHLEVKEWKTDVYLSVTLHYDVVLKVFDQDAQLLALSSLSGVEVIGGGGFESGNSLSAVSAFEQKVSYLFNDEKVKLALNVKS